MLFEKKISLILFVILFSCHQTTKSNQFVETYSTHIRNFIKEKVKPLPKVNYQSIFGRTPSKEELELGRNLFNDPILSRNNDISCSTCHLSNHGFADGNPLPVGALGIGGPTGNNVGRKFAEGVLSTDRSLGNDSMGFQAESYMFRNSLSTINVIYRMNKNNKEGLFHDGRFGSLFFQTLLPIHTSIEMCGDNFVPIKNNPFTQNGPFFTKPVKITHSNTFDIFSGKDTGYFNATSTIIKGVPSFRPDGSRSVPVRNECLAIAIAKLRKIPFYVKQFKKIYDSEINDQILAVSLTAFISTHVSKNTPFDQFLLGKNTLNQSELIGLVSFFTKMGKEFSYKKLQVKGSGCFACHDGPTFGGKGYASLGVRGSKLSPLSRAKYPSEAKSSFFGRVSLQRGEFPQCYVKGETISRSGYAPDMGRANGTFKVKDCFKFRVPPLRNIIETYPYFHHGTARAQDFKSNDFKMRSIKALEQVVKYHLRGPIDTKLFSMNNHSKYFFDTLYQIDYFVPQVRQNFVSKTYEKNDLDQTKIFPIILKEQTFHGLIDFIAYGLWDKKATQIGDLNNDISHPKKVASGFTPTITRDQGNQLELAPAFVK